MTDTNPNTPFAGRRATKRGVATYEKVIHAGIALIASKGFHAASSNRIAEAAGVTWGTLQHQFGDKASLLEAILQFCFKEQMQQLEQATSGQQPLQQRIDAIIEAIWHNQQSDSSRALQEIIMAVQSDSALSARFHPTLQKLRDLYDDQWRQFFADIEIPAQQMEAVKQLAYATLRGLAFDIVVRSSDQSIQAAKELLKDTMLRCFTDQRL